MEVKIQINVHNMANRQTLCNDDRTTKIGDRHKKEIEWQIDREKEEETKDTCRGRGKELGIKWRCPN